VTAALTTWDGRSLAYTVVGEYFGELAGLDDQLRLVLLQPRGTDGSDAPAERFRASVLRFLGVEL
jgi:hypothetical protein